MFEVNLVHDQGLRGTADMGAAPQQPEWTAGKAIDGYTNQSYLSNSCAITNFDENRNTSIWWRLWLQKKFNVAYIEIFFRSDSKFINMISLKFSIFYCVSFRNINCLLIILILKMSLLTAYLFLSL